MKKIKDIIKLYTDSKTKYGVEADFAQWLLDPHDSEAKEKEMEDLWRRTPNRLLSVHRAKRKVDSILFPEHRIVKHYRIALAGAFAVAASLAIVLILSYVITPRYGVPNYSEVNTISGENTEIELSDGTKVILNSHSKLIYPEVFVGKKREVFLSGEAIFDVAEDRTAPFVVNVSDYSIEVLGTVFNVTDYMDDMESRLALKEGLVKINIPGCDPIYIEENQGIVYDKSDHSLKQITVDVSSVMSWSDGVMCFDGSDIYEIIKMAERRYGVSIICSDHPKYMNARITARFDACEDVESLLSVLEKLIPGMQYSKTASAIYLK